MNHAHTHMALQADTKSQTPLLPRVSLGLTMGAAFAMFITVGLFHVWTQTAILNAGYALARERQIQSDLEDAQRRLQLQIARLRAPARLEAVAIGRGFRKAEPGEAIMLEARP